MITNYIKNCVQEKPGSAKMTLTSSLSYNCSCDSSLFFTSQDVKHYNVERITKLYFVRQKAQI